MRLHGYTCLTYLLEEGEDKSLTILAFVNGIHIHTESNQQVRSMKGGMKINVMAYNLYNQQAMVTNTVSISDTQNMGYNTS